MPLYIRLFLGLLALPINVLIIIPAILIWFSADSAWGAFPRSNFSWPLWLGGLFSAGGLALMVWTVTDFFKSGEGTPAPWDPPQKLVVNGPYRYVRNPMISGAIMVLFAETLIIHSWALAAWLVFFIFANMIYLPFKEEPGLEKRFGDDYHFYKENVPRWIPRLTPWSLSESQPTSSPPE